MKVNTDDSWRHLQASKNVANVHGGHWHVAKEGFTHDEDDFSFRKVVYKSRPLLVSNFDGVVTPVNGLING